MAVKKSSPPPQVKPGQKVPDSGIYGAGGIKSTLVEGEPAPPTPGKGQKWTQLIDTNPKN